MSDRWDVDLLRPWIHLPDFDSWRVAGSLQLWHSVPAPPLEFAMRSAVCLFAMMSLPLHAQTRLTLTTPEAVFVTKDISVTKNADGKAATVAVNLQRRRQVMEGFGACFNELGWTALNTLPAAERDEVLKELFSAEGCNFSICRLPIGANDYSLSWYSHDEKSDDFRLFQSLFGMKKKVDTARNNRCFC